MPLNRVDLPAPFGPTTATSAPFSTAPLEVMHRWVPLIAEREIAKEKFRHGHLFSVGWDISGPGFQEIAHSADAQISTISTPATAIRCGAESRNSEGADRRRRMGHAAVMVVGHNVTI